MGMRSMGDPVPFHSEISLWIWSEYGYAQQAPISPGRSPRSRTAAGPWAPGPLAPWALAP